MIAFTVLNSKIVAVIKDETVLSFESAYEAFTKMPQYDKEKDENDRYYVVFLSGHYTIKERI